ncbi:uncharacterized protein LOC129590015 [Paramacrobiotus metropolitanus]|uniref:uncharacterized protein LOC129590015 n=1 Tax=Paramacrobiotus metropolitanus TaxID=2943436 RepID=UPI002445822E|nr:uncharacterized protein LOC129590015 [Paramacrobiotus metropolitanus]XP_055340956.1 uncharacterized protein LOC129590015 [Paramacrobiotus metropolitanus]XP_055340957.1 uncharacterized protein LOC129590015 [Paramacrobiotus metropolitanus]
MDEERSSGGGEIFEKYYHDLQEEIIYDAKMRLKKLIGDKIPIKEKERILKESEAKMWVLMKEYIRKPTKEEEKRNSWKDYQEGRNMFSVCVQPIMNQAVDEMMSIYADELHKRPPPNRQEPKEESDDEIDFASGMWAKDHRKESMVPK